MTTTMDEDAFLELAGEGFNVIPLAVTLQLDRDTPVSLFQRFGGGRAVFLLESAAVGETTGRYSFIGLDRRWRVHVRDGETLVSGLDVAPDPRGPLETLRVILQRYQTYRPSDLPDFFGGAVGFLTYDYVRRLERLPRGDEPEWPDVDFSFPSAVLVVDHLRYSTTAVINVVLESKDDPAEAYRRARTYLDELIATLLGPGPDRAIAVERLVATAPNARDGVDIRQIAASLSNFEQPAYEAIVRRAQAYIVSGDVFQVVVSQQFTRETTVDPLTLYRVLRALNPSPYMYLLDTGDAHIVGASPEMLVRVHDGTVSTRPIAGTRPRGATEEQDAALEAEILRDEKELAEHVMLVDLGRNDVGRVAAPGSVRVERLAHVERFSHLMHLVSQVSGRLRDGLDAFDAFNALFPAGTLSGAPKVRAMEIIDELEPVRRGIYGGAVGYFALSGNADFAITIRTVYLRDGRATVSAGGGIVAHSLPAAEYRECINKASAPLLALQIADPR